MGSATIEVDTEILAGSGPGPLEKRMRVLAAEDNPVFQSMLRSMLTKWGYEAIITSDGKQAWERLQGDDRPHMAILDWMMPGMDGVELCRRVRAMAKEPYIYIILLTARTENQDLIDGMDAGADDYLKKPFNAHELRVRLRAGRRILELQEQLLHTREALRLQATHDGLTGLLNRTSVLESIENELARAQREHQPMALLLIDLDRFKLINDTRGHLAGDAVLREAARRMKSATRRYDIVGRYGGEEFLVVLPACSGTEAATQAERIRQEIEREGFEAGGELVPVTCSIGVSWRPEPSRQDAARMIRDADLALYRVKARGRNGVELAGPV